MIDYVKRLAKTGSAYAASSVLAKVIALFTLPIYTHFVGPRGFGQVGILASTVIVLSIFFRLGVIEALLRFYYQQDRYDANEVVRTAFWSLLITTSAGTLVCFLLAPQIAEWLLRNSAGSLTLARFAVVWFWFATFYELLLVFYRVDERAGAYASATVANVLITVPLTFFLVVFEKAGAKGLLVGNAAGTALVVCALLVIQTSSGRIARPGLPLIRPMLSFGLPTVPGEISLYALNWVDRVMLLRLPSSRAVGIAAAGLYSVAVMYAQGVTVFVRGFQMAWPPLAYSIDNDSAARVVYGRLLTYYMLVISSVVVGLALISRWLTQILDAKFFDAYRAVPLVATGVALYGAYLVLVSAVARMGKTGSLAPIAIAGLATNFSLCFVLIPGMGITGAGVALIGAYLMLLSLMYLRARATLGLILEWRRLAQIVGVALTVSLIGEHVLPVHGIRGLWMRLLWWFLYPTGLVVSGFFSRAELSQLKNARSLLRTARESRSLGEHQEVSQQLREFD